MKIAMLSSHTTSLRWFRMDLLREFIRRGHSVVALADGDESVWKEKFKMDGVDYRQAYIRRNSTNPYDDIKTLIELFKFMKKEKPDKVFAYQAKTLIYGSIAARLSGITEIYLLVGGLGSIFIGAGFKNKILRTIIRIEYWVACRCSKMVFFQNSDDRSEFIRSGLITVDKTKLLKGSGVDLDRFQPAPLPAEPAFLFIGRLIKDKGILEYLEACKAVKSEYPHTRCLLVGPYDTNPSALKPEELHPYINNGIIEYFGEQEDVRPFIARCSVLVLPSYHEGLPKAVAEAMAMGRAIITTNAPGCKETVTDGVNGYLVDMKDIPGLVAKMKDLICNHRISEKMGAESAKIAIQKYDVKIINQALMQHAGLI